MDDEDFVAFVDARYGDLLRFGTLVMGDLRDGEDLLQTALLNTYAARWRVQSGWEPYVRAAMIRLAWRSRRRFWRREHSTGELPDTPVVVSAFDYAGSFVVRGALRRLPIEQRIPLVLRYWLDMSEAAIASELGIPAGTVKSRTHRGLATLRRDLEIAALASEEVP